MSWLTDREDASRLETRSAPAFAPPTQRRRWRRVVAVLVVTALAATGVTAALLSPGRETATVTPQPSQASTPAATREPTTPEPSRSATPQPTTDVSEAGSAQAVLASLQVKGRAPKTGYDRDAWQVWSDYDGNRCNERQDTLARDLTDVQRVGCDVVGGTIVDPYTGREIQVPTADPQIDIDHVVALSDAWQKGASGWSAEEMQRFASDPLNLLAVSSSANRQKSDGDAATWLPANKSYRCDYVARQIAVKAEYGLWVTQAEHDAMAQILTVCPNQALPERAAAPARVAVISNAPAADTGGAVVDSALDPQFSSCRALKAAGYPGRYVQGQDPEYDWYRDADSDGIVCE